MFKPKEPAQEKEPWESHALLRAHIIPNVLWEHALTTYVHIKMSKAKKILIIISVMLTITFVAVLVYYLFFKKPPTAVTPSEPGFIDIETGISEQERQRLIAVTEE